MAADPMQGTTAFAKSVSAWLVAERKALEGFRRAPYEAVSEYLERLRPFQRLLFDEGWSRCGWPEKYGGLGGDPALRGVLYDEIYGCGLDLPRGFELLEVIGPTLLSFAPPLAAEVMPLLIRGDLAMCQGFSEPDAGSDLASLRTRADRSGDRLVLNGQKAWVSLANVADRCLLLARTGTRESRHRGITALWLDLSLPGIGIRPITFVDGRDEFAEISLEDVNVSSDMVIGEVDRGWDVAMYLLQFERGNYAWQRQAWLRNLLEQSLRAPGQADRGTLPATMVGEAWLSVSALRSSSRRTLVRLANGETLAARTSLDKLLMTSAEQSVLDAVRAVTWPACERAPSKSEWEDDWFYSRAASVYGGASEVQRDIVAEKLLGLPR